ncbi:Sodium/calcium exchanger membrane region [Ceraceosorus bombacis]|uniref:Sodium/calcium exchanger membrane region n=1 Tax=Ceraceosorus bombacis TaxID=401625 RepID=A0A0N7L9Z2_9BASI|nr:Sodium/calcium exchanger membrane region [Ceraceosorus bombacis]
MSLPASTSYTIATLISSTLTLILATKWTLDAACVIARRAKVHETIVALLLSGIAWEQLVIIIFSLLQHRPDLILGISVGTCLLNNTLLFGVHLVLLPRRSLRSFSTSSINYTLLQSIFCIPIAILLGVTFDVYPPLFKSRWSRYMKRAAHINGVLLVVVFVAYLAFAALALYKGHLQHPEDPDSDDDASSASSSDADAESGEVEETRSAHSERSAASFVPAGLLAQASGAHTTITTPLLSRLRNQPRSTSSFHFFVLIASLALIISGGMLIPHSAIHLACNIHLRLPLLALTLLPALVSLPSRIWNLVNAQQPNLDGLLVEISSKNIFLLTFGVGLSLLAGVTHDVSPSHSSSFSSDPATLLLDLSVSNDQYADLSNNLAPISGPLEAQDLLLLSLSSLALLLFASLSSLALLILAGTKTHRIVGLAFALTWIMWTAAQWTVWR